MSNEKRIVKVERNYANDHLRFSYADGTKEPYPIHYGESSGDIATRYVYNKRVNRQYHLIEHRSQIDKKLKTGDFENCIFLINTNFRPVKFTEIANFTQAIFTQEANFEGATFTQEATFMNAEFLQKAQFKGATFVQKADFSETTFMQKANFMNARFEGEAIFWGAIFERESYFLQAKFTQAANFYNAIFMETAGFQGATFEKETTFSAIAYTQNTTFNFYLAMFSDTLFLNNIVPIDSTQSTTPLNINLKLVTIEKIDYSDAQFSADNRETFLTLKNIALKQNDRIRALEFHRQEYEQHLKDEKLNFWDKCILKFESCTSKFGTLVWLPICWLLGVILAFYFLITCFICNASLNIDSFFAFIQPTNFFKDIFPCCSPDSDWIMFLAQTLILLYKILQLVFIYEIIKSFRKFSRTL